MLRTSMLMAMSMLMASDPYYLCKRIKPSSSSGDGFKKRIQKNSILREKRTFVINGVTIEAPDKKTARKIYERLSK